ncbi:MAG: homoserine kinase [Bacteroidia bacterium]|nr:homoserine kinase [Bacteroidia bacterium]
MKQILLRTPATTANVGPGYDIFALALKEPYDEIYLSLNTTGKITIEIEGGHQNIPADIQDNTAGLALIELFKRYKSGHGIHVRITKRMISGAGLGTTGAAASAAVYGACNLLELTLSNNEMIDIARLGEVASGGSPHADNVAAALLGGFTLIKCYKPLEVLKLNIPEIPVVLAVIRKGQRTTRGFITYEIGEEKLKEQIARCSAVIHALHCNDIAEFGKAINVDHIAEPVRGAAIPKYKETKAKILEAGAWGCTISGGGSSIIAFCDINHQNQIASLMEKEFSENPLFDSIIKTTTSNQGIVIV